MVEVIVGLILLLSSDWLFAMCSTPQTSTSILSSVGVQQFSVLISVLISVIDAGVTGATVTGFTGAGAVGAVLPSLSWMSLCCFNVKDLRKVLWQISHSNALTFVCVF